MEGLSGFDVAETLRDVYRIPFMFLSAFADEATLAQVRALGAVAYMTKPLDVGEIVPTVEGAFKRLRETGSAAPASVPPPVRKDPLIDPVPLALGVLMHRHSLARGAAHERLQRMAVAAGLDEAAQAERLLAALEELARSA
ncbi:MAG TPA: response regulator, partial [Rubrivivax sp.]|nr:response regulator [Rubrivivax sp.]